MDETPNPPGVQGSLAQPGEQDSTQVLRPPKAARETWVKLAAWREQAERDIAGVRKDLDETRNYLELSTRVSAALEELSQELFRQMLDYIEKNLTIMLQEVLDQPIALEAVADWKRNSATVSFQIKRNGNYEDILKGQGGSVVNILSVGLRMFALMTLDEKRHRRFLVLDEQDCWIRPDLVPRLVRIVREAGEKLGYQVLMISHHDATFFSRHADKVYRLTPGKNGVKTELVEVGPAVKDPEAD